MQILQTSDSDRELTVTHMHYTAWPDHGLPQNAMSLISFIRHVHKEHPVSLDQPLLVHCSAGVGRTGTFIFLDRVMQQMKREYLQYPEGHERTACEDGPDRGSSIHVRLVTCIC